MIYLSYRELKQVWGNEWRKKQYFLADLRAYRDSDNNPKKTQTLPAVNILINNLGRYAESRDTQLQLIESDHLKALGKDFQLTPIINKYSILLSLLIHSVEEELSAQPSVTHTL